MKHQTTGRIECDGAAAITALRKRAAALAEARMRHHILRSLVTNGVLPPSPKKGRAP